MSDGRRLLPKSSPLTFAPCAWPSMAGCHVTPNSRGPDHERVLCGITHPPLQGLPKAPAAIDHPENAMNCRCWYIVTWRPRRHGRPELPWTRGSESTRGSTSRSLTACWCVLCAMNHRLPPEGEPALALWQDDSDFPVFLVQPTSGLIKELLL